MLMWFSVYPAALTCIYPAALFKPCAARQFTADAIMPISYQNRKKNAGVVS
jgi:hypothetical protein